MALDEEMEEALRKVVSNVGQPDEVAKGLIAWMRALSEGELSDSDKRSHLDSVRDAVKMEGSGAD